MSVPAQDNPQQATSVEAALMEELAEAKQRIVLLDEENGRLRNELAKLRASWAKRTSDHASSRLRDALRE